MDFVRLLLIIYNYQDPIHVEESSIIFENQFLEKKYIRICLNGTFYNITSN